VDGQIAAIAHSESLTLVTANTGDYQYFGDLEIADWTR
jgi:predicted nucleic acid-binding protein